MEQLGNQGGFADLLNASDGMKEGAGIFKSSVASWTFGVLAIKTLFQSEEFKGFGRTVSSLAGSVVNLGEIFTTIKIADMFGDLISGVYDTRKELEKTYGLFGESQDDFTNAIIEQSKEAVEFGIGTRDITKSFKELANQFRNADFALQFAGVSAEFAKGFDISIESSAEIVGNLAKFGGKDVAGVSAFMEDINKMSADAGVSHELVAENISQSAKSMYRFQLNTGKGEAKFKRLAVHATRMGVDIGHMVEAMDKYRNIPGALEGSVTASLAGLNISSMQLLAGARAGDPTQLFADVLGHLEGFTNEFGALDSVGIDLADILGPMVNMSRDELQRSLLLMHDDNKSSLAYSKSFHERLEAQQTIQTKIQNSLYGIFDAIKGPANFLFGILEAITSHTKILQGIFIATVGGWALYKANTIFGKVRLAQAATGLSGGAATAGIFHGIANAPRKLWQHLTDKGMWKGAQSTISPEAADLPDSSKPGKPKPRKPRPRRPDGTFGTGMSPVKIRAYAKAMMASAVPMLAFAGSIWILSKAFQNMEDLKWETIRSGLATMGAMALSMTLMGRYITANAKPLMAMGVMMLALSASMIGLAFAAQLLNDVNLANIGMGLINLSAGMASMMLVGAGLSTGLGALFGLVGLGGLLGTIAAIGAIASKYASPIETLSTSMLKLAEAMERLQAIEVQGIDLTRTKNALSGLEKFSLDLVGAKATAVREIIENHITIDIDGTKLTRLLVNSEGTRAG